MLRYPQGDGCAAPCGRCLRCNRASWVLEIVKVAELTTHSQELAGLLPTLKNAKEAQLSKHVIVDESVKRHHAQEATISELNQSLDDLKKRHEQLLAEVNAWRSGFSLPPWQHSDSSAARDAAAAASGQPAGSLGQQAAFSGVPENVLFQAMHGSTSGMHQFVPQPQKPLLPDLGTYPDSLVQLDHDLPHSSASASGPGQPNGILHGAGVPEMRPQMEAGENPNASGSNYQDHRLQRLFGRFQDPSLAPSGQQQQPQQQQPPPQMGGMLPASPPFEMHDLWQQTQTQQQPNWPPDPSHNWMLPGTAQESGDMDLNAMYFRHNSATIMNT